MSENNPLEGQKPEEKEGPYETPEGHGYRYPDGTSEMTFLSGDIDFERYHKNGKVAIRVFRENREVEYYDENETIIRRRNDDNEELPLPNLENTKLFRYKAMNAMGREEEGTIKADDIDSAEIELTKRGLVHTFVEIDETPVSPADVPVIDAEKVKKPFPWNKALKIGAAGLVAAGGYFGGAEKVGKTVGEWAGSRAPAKKVVKVDAKKNAAPRHVVSSKTNMSELKERVQSTTPAKQPSASKTEVIEIEQRVPPVPEPVNLPQKVEAIETPRLETVRDKTDVLKNYPTREQAKKIDSLLNPEPVPKPLTAEEKIRAELKEKYEKELSGTKQELEAAKKKLAEIEAAKFKPKTQLETDRAYIAEIEKEWKRLTNEGKNPEQILQASQTTEYIRAKDRVERAERIEATNKK